MSDYQHILVGIDGSKQSVMALDKAIDVAKRNHASIQLLSVVNGEHYPDAAGYGIIDHDVYDKAKQKMTDLLGKMSQRAKDAGVTDVKADVMVGNVKLALTEQWPQNHDVDLLIVGATGLNVIGRMIVGSTAAYVVREAPCDVMVVKTDLDNKPYKVDESSYLNV